MKTIKVLLVEDSPADARLVKEVFKEENIMATVDIATDGQEAMSYLRQEGKRPNLVILDLNLPKKDGREVLKEIKSDPELKSIPVIILTTSQSEEDIANSYRLQASCYVIKQIELEEFIKVIKSIDEFWFSSVRYPHE